MFGHGGNLVNLGGHADSLCYARKQSGGGHIRDRDGIESGGRGGSVDRLQMLIRVVGAIGFACNANAGPGLHVVTYKGSKPAVARR